MTTEKPKEYINDCQGGTTPYNITFRYELIIGVIGFRLKKNLTLEGTISGGYKTGVKYIHIVKKTPIIFSTSRK
jgi:hypothetical protein